MTTENDFIPFAVGGSANVISQATYAADTTLTQGGFTAGIATSAQLNKVWRQSSIMAAVIASFIVAETGQTAIDDGTTATLLTNFTNAVNAASKNKIILTDTGTANAYTAANPVPLTALPTATGFTQTVKIAHLNTGTSTYAPDGLATAPIYGLGGAVLQGGELPANGVATLVSFVDPLLNSGNLCWVLYECVGGAQQVPPATASQHAVQLGQLASGLNLATPAQFDNSTKMASTAFVWQNRAGFNGVLGPSSNTTLTTANLGSFVACLNAASPFTITLPVTTSAFASVSTRIVNISSQTITIQTQSGGTIQGPFNTVGGTSFTIPSNSCVDVLCNNANNFIVSGDGQIGSSFLFANGTGFQKFPGGLIIQFSSFTASATPGAPVTVTYPIPFPVATTGIATTVSSASTSIVASWYDTPTVNGFNGHGSLATLTCNYIAVGH
ncbi:gp53-like domain-containing protein [Paraburkholderia sp. BCC1885]|uniref:gp53-like domain-containing protein n=1 Tax=Paraburkholderia sp. BCC1885 TaxID=2562669 RepID=UPI0021B293FF|nr:hypothetical protein [Paraburkholderia sp. BCC1885]